MLLPPLMMFEPLFHCSLSYSVIVNVPSLLSQIALIGPNTFIIPIMPFLGIQLLLVNLDNSWHHITRVVQLPGIHFYF